MTDKEKARAYDEALEVMRQWIAPCHTKEQLDTLKKSVFPELAESEDERIRKWILEYLYDGLQKSDTPFKDNLFKSAIAYLEKQKEQKPFNVCEQCPYYKDCPDYNEKKQEWSEEDKRILRRIIERLSVDKNISLFEFKEMETFLNSYRP